MEEKNKVTQEQKLTYEQLENVAHQLSEQSRQLYQRLQEVNMENTFKRLDFLFKVVNSTADFPKTFVDNCKAEIVSLITIQDEETSETKE